MAMMLFGQAVREFQYLNIDCLWQRLQPSIFDIRYSIFSVRYYVILCPKETGDTGRVGLKLSVHKFKTTFFKLV